MLEPTALSVAVRQECGRRLRVVGTIELPVLSDLLRKLGQRRRVPRRRRRAAARRPPRHAAARRHLAAHRWGRPPTELLVAALGYPVVPVRVRPGGPLGLPLTPWRVHFGTPILVGAIGDRDPLSAAELAEAVRAAVLELV